MKCTSVSHPSICMKRDLCRSQASSKAWKIHLFMVSFRSITWASQHARQAAESFAMSATCTWNIWNGFGVSTSSPCLSSVCPDDRSSSSRSCLFRDPSRVHVFFWRTLKTKHELHGGLNKRMKSMTPAQFRTPVTPVYRSSQWVKSDGLPPKSDKHCENLWCGGS